MANPYCKTNDKAERIFFIFSRINEFESLRHAISMPMKLIASRFGSSPHQYIIRQTQRTYVSLMPLCPAIGFHEQSPWLCPVHSGPAANRYNRKSHSIFLWDTMIYQNKFMHCFRRRQYERIIFPSRKGLLTAKKISFNLEKSISYSAALVLLHIVSILPSAKGFITNPKTAGHPFLLSAKSRLRNPVHGFRTEPSAVNRSSTGNRIVSGPPAVASITLMSPRLMRTTIFLRFRTGMRMVTLPSTSV